MFKKSSSSQNRLHLTREFLITAGLLFGLSVVLILSLRTEETREIRTRAATQSITLQVVSGNDDADQLDGGQTHLSEPYVRMDCDDSNPGNFSANGGFRFRNVTIPPGSTINSATFQVYVRGTTYDNPNSDVYAEKTADAVDFAAKSVNLRVNKTSASVPWVAGGVGEGYEPLEIKNVINEIINNQPGWSSGNAIAILVHSRWCETTYNAFWARSYESGSATAAKLTINYTTPLPPAPTATITANDSGGSITIAYNTAATIKWGSTNATSCSVSPIGWIGTSNTAGISTGNLTTNKTYTLSCSGDGGGPVTDSVTVNVASPPKPTVTISASPASISSGQSSTITWSCTPNDGTVSVSITANPPPNIGTSLPCTGSKTVTPGQSIAYTAIASGPVSNSDPKSTSITVNGQPPPTPPPPNPPKPPKPLGPGPSVGALETLQLEISVPNLIGKMKIKTDVGGVAKELEVSKENKNYSLDLKGASISLNKEYNLVITGEKILVRKVRFTPTASSTNLNAGDLVLGDSDQDNRIDSEDEAKVVDSIANQTLVGDINGDKDTNSLDWAIVIANLGKKGD